MYQRLTTFPRTTFVFYKLHAWQAWHRRFKVRHSPTESEESRQRRGEKRGRRKGRDEGRVREVLHYGSCTKQSAAAYLPRWSKSAWRMLLRQRQNLCPLEERQIDGFRKLLASTTLMERQSFIWSFSLTGSRMSEAAMCRFKRHANIKMPRWIMEHRWNVLNSGMTFTLLN